MGGGGGDVDDGAVAASRMGRMKVWRPASPMRLLLTSSDVLNGPQRCWAPACRSKMPPAQLTRISTGPSLARMSSRILTAPGSPILPVTAQVRVPELLHLLRHDPRSAARRIARALSSRGREWPRRHRAHSLGHLAAEPAPTRSRMHLPAQLLRHALPYINPIAAVGRRSAGSCHELVSMRPRRPPAAPTACGSRYRRRAADTRAASRPPARRRSGGYPFHQSGVNADAPRAPGLETAVSLVMLADRDHLAVRHGAVATADEAIAPSVHCAPRVLEVDMTDVARDPP